MRDDGSILIAVLVISLLIGIAVVALASSTHRCMRLAQDLASSEEAGLVAERLVLETPLHPDSPWHRAHAVHGRINLERSLLVRYGSDGAATTIVVDGRVRAYPIIDWDRLLHSESVLPLSPSPLGERSERGSILSPFSARSIHRVAFQEMNVTESMASRANLSLVRLQVRGVGALTLSVAGYLEAERVEVEGPILLLSGGDMLIGEISNPHHFPVTLLASRGLLRISRFTHSSPLRLYGRYGVEAPLPAGSTLGPPPASLRPHIPLSLIRGAPPR